MELAGKRVLVVEGEAAFCGIVENMLRAIETGPRRRLASSRPRSFMGPLSTPSRI